MKNSFNKSVDPRADAVGAPTDGKASTQLFRCVQVILRGGSFDVITLFILLFILLLTSLFKLLFILLFKMLFKLLFKMLFKLLFKMLYKMLLLENT